MDIAKLVSQMTLEEKASYLSGKGFWHLKAVERLGIPSVMVSDGPHGLRKQESSGDHLGLSDSVVTTCFPTAAGMAASFDRSLAHTLGEALGEECQAEDVSVILGPGANIKRSPLCGRNFEYYSEDPFLSGEMAAAHIRGVQSKYVGTSLKHFAVNNQEDRRMSVDVTVDERALREIYLASFEYAVKGGRPWTVMCAYNKLAGVYASENALLLRRVLRDEWGFDGYTMTDWGACADHIKGVVAGMDLEMPSTGGLNDNKLIEAVRQGEIEESVVDEAVSRMLTIVFRYVENRDKDVVYDRAAHHHLARRIAREAMVLLKNEGGVLPLGGSKKVAFIGKYAQTPRYQGAGSSRINPYEITSALDAVRSVAEVAYAQGFDDAQDEPNEVMLSQAVRVAEEADVAVLFVGLPDSFESEGFDRGHMCMPNNQTRLIEEICKVNKAVVIVLHNGSPVEMPWADDVQAILEAYLGGEAVGGAVVDLLFGAVSPCGKLAETFPLHLEDTPCFGNFPGDGDHVRYGEGIYVGYRHYDTRRMEVLFPFGHGLTYTTFTYSNLKLDNRSIAPGGKVTVSVDVTNTGRFAAKEIVQVYVHSAHAGVTRPAQELKGFDKVSLAPGETKSVHIVLDSRSFAYWEESIHDWYVEGGEYEIRVGASCRDIRMSARLEVSANKPLPVVVTPDTTIGDIMAMPGGMHAIEPLLNSFSDMMGGERDETTAAMMQAVVRYIPLHTLRSFAGDTFTDEVMWRIIGRLNQ